MNALLVVLLFLFSLGLLMIAPGVASAALLICLFLAVPIGYAISLVNKDDRKFLLQIFVSSLLVRLLVASVIFFLNLQYFFGADAYTYDNLGYALLKVWEGEHRYNSVLANSGFGTFQGMPYLVAAVYSIAGRNMLAVQFVTAVLGAATAPVTFLCAQHIFGSTRVARVTALFVAFYPSLILWSAQGLKDGPIVFLLVLTMLATLKLGDRINFKYFALLIGALFGILTLRFYIFYMVLVAIGGAFLIGMRVVTSQSLLRQCAIIVGLGLAMTYLGVLRTARDQFETFGNLERVQVSRAELAQSAQSGFGRDVDVSTTAGALSTIPLGLVYLLFAPFPWQLANLRQSITLPEMLVWWASFPLLVLGGWFTIKHRMRQALPILLFTLMLTLAYSIFQGNVGTAYRQRSQLLVFYFIFVAVGGVLLREQQEWRRHQVLLVKQQEAAQRAKYMAESRRRYELWKVEREKEQAERSQGLSEA